MTNLPLKIVFIGTAAIGAPLLESLTSDDRFKVIKVITQPDKPAGRKMQLKPTPIKLAAADLGLQVDQPDSINSSDAIDSLKQLEPDFLVVMAYGQILSEAVLQIPVIAPINIHASLLPKYRGASPIQAAILNGDKQSGISIMHMVKDMDAGPVYQTATTTITATETAATLHDKLADLAAQITPDSLVQIAKGQLSASGQNQGVTYCHKIQKADGKLDFTKSATELDRQIRAFTPWPGTFTFFSGKRLKIISAEAVDTPQEPGRVFQIDRSVFVGCNRGSLKLLSVHPEGKKPMTPIEFIKGNPDFINSKLPS